MDLLVRYLMAKPRDLGRNEVIQRVFVQAYRVLEAYLLGDSRKNELYFARHIQYFSTQFEEPVGYLRKHHLIHYKIVITKIRSMLFTHAEYLKIKNLLLQ